MAELNLPQCFVQEFGFDVVKNADVLKFANLQRFQSTFCYAKTKFHLKFYTEIKNARIIGEESENTFFTGIEGIGKTSTLIFYVLECFKRKDDSIHYVDLKEIAKSEKKLEGFITCAKKFKDKDYLIIDHVTVFNMPLVKRIKGAVDAALRFIFVETGFTASVRMMQTFSKECQLDEDDFENLWIKTLKSIPDPCEKVSENLLGRGKEIFAFFSKKSYLITPRLFHFVWRKMYNGCSLGETFMYYRKKKRDDIEQFVEIQDEDSEFLTFLLHTRTLLYHIPEDADYVLDLPDFEKLRVAVNIFNVEYLEVTDNDKENDIRLFYLNLEDGCYVRLSHLIPPLAKFWAEKLPFRFEAVIDLSPILLSIMFQNGGGRKEIENLIVNFQKGRGFAIVPRVFEETIYRPATSECKVVQAEDFSVHNKCGFYSVDLDDLKRIVTDFKGHEKNVAKCAIWLKENIKEELFLLQPEIGKLMGVDYFVFKPNKSSEHCCTASKVPKLRNTLFAVQVAMGKSHCGDTIGRALDVLKKVLPQDEILIHVVVLIATTKNDMYTLSRCRLENVSVINLNTSWLLDLIQKDKILYKLLMQVLINNE